MARKYRRKKRHHYFCDFKCSPQRIRSRKRSGWGMNLYRNTRDGKIAGVCAGLADHWDVAHWVVRLMWIFLAICGAFPIAFWGYIAGWVLMAPRGTRVLGVTRSSKRREEVGLVILEEDGRTLSFVGRGWNRRLTVANARIEDATLSPAAAHVAYSTARGEVFVYSVDHDAFLYRLLREGS